MKNIATIITSSFAIIFTLFSLVSNGFAQTTRLDEGISVRLRLLQQLSSDSAITGQTINFEVMENIKVGEKVLIAEGASASGTIVEAQAKRSLGRPGKLSYRLDFVIAVDGTKVPLRATQVSQGEGKSGTTGALAVGTAVVFFPAAPLFLMMKGKDITVPKGFQVEAFVDGGRDIKLKEELAPAAGVAPATTANTNNSNSDNNKFCMVNVVSESNHGDIEIDGVFYGSTPSSVRIAAGQHTFTVKKKGFKTWERSFNIAPGNITLRVELEEEEKVVETKTVPKHK